MVNMITVNQRKAIWASARERGYGEDNVYVIIQNVTGKNHMKELTYSEAARVFAYIRNTPTFNRPSKSCIGANKSYSRLSAIYESASLLGWNILRLNRYIWNKYRASDIASLSAADQEELLNTLSVIKNKQSSLI